MKTRSASRLEALLTDSDPWLERLARRLVGVDRAPDVAQETLAAGFERFGSEPVPRPWLARVVRNLAAREHRSAARRRRRESLAARSESLDPTAEAHLERLEVRRRVTAAVLALSEPGRSCVIFRYFEGLGPTEIADRTGESVRTVESRLRRSLDRLRTHLLRESDDREAWIASLAAVAHGGSVATGPSIQVASVAGGALIVGKWIAVVGAVLVGLFFGWELLDRESTAPAVDERTLAEAPREEVTASLETIPPEPAADRVVEAPKREQGSRATPEEAAALPEGLWISWGPHSELEALRTANWLELGESVLVLLELVEEGRERERRGLPPDEDAFGELMEHAKKTEVLAAQLRGRIPTVLEGRGELTHPLVASNLVAFALHQAGVPLTESQVKRIAREGEEFEKYWEGARARFDGEPFTLGRVLRELDVRSRFQGRFDTILDSRQREVVFPRALAGRVSLDLLSPRALLTTAVEVYRAEPGPEIGEPFLGEIDRALGVPREEWDARNQYSAGYRQRLHAYRIQRNEQHASFERAEAIARFQLEVLEQIDHQLRLDDDQRARLHAVSRIYVPAVK